MSRQRVVFLAITGLLLGSLHVVPTAQAVVPGANGLIAFTSIRDGNREIYVMNADGSGQTNLTNNPAWDMMPAWSPDGTKIAFSTTRDGDFDIYVMNADGSGQTDLSNNTVQDFYPSWSPDGTKIAYQHDPSSDGTAPEEIYVMNADGSGQTDLTNNPARDSNPAWSPDGTKIAFATDREGDNEIYLMNPDGTGQANLSNNHFGGDGAPAWSPDGTKIVFGSDRGSIGYEIYVMNADGTGPVNLTNNNWWADGTPAWSPDGTKIVFFSDRDGNFEIYVMNADGSGQTNLTNNPAYEDDPSWQTAAPPPLWSPPAPTLTVVRVGAGSGTITSSPPGINCPPDCSERPVSGRVPAATTGDVYVLTAHPTAGSVFTRWAGACSGNGTCRVVLSNDTFVAAWFDLAGTPSPTPSPSPTPPPAPTTFDLNVFKVGKGRVMSASEEINCGQACTATYDEGTMVTLTATPRDGWMLERWRYGCSGSELVCTLEMSSNRRAKAVFVRE